MRNQTLEKLLTDLRSEARLSLNPAHNVQVRDAQIILLQRTQERLWEDFAWPHMRVQRTVPIAVGQRYYDTPSDIVIDQIEKLEIFRDGGWYHMVAGVDGPEYSIWNSDLDQRSYPPRRWKISENEDIEIWPISDTAGDPATQEGYLKFTGIRNLNPLVEPDDRADLDDRMLVLYAAAEILAASGAKDAQIKLDLANRRYAKQRGGLTPAKRYRMFGIGSQPVQHRPFITRYVPPGG